jgi:hypothetical protein
LLRHEVLLRDLRGGREESLALLPVPPVPHAGTGPVRGRKGAKWHSPACARAHGARRPEGPRAACAAAVIECLWEHPNAKAVPAGCRAGPYVSTHWVSRSARWVPLRSIRACC